MFLITMLIPPQQILEWAILMASLMVVATFILILRLRRHTECTEHLIMCIITRPTKALYGLQIVHPLEHQAIRIAEQAVRSSSRTD